MTQVVQKQATEIKSAVVYRCKDKATHETFYLVQSDSQAHTFYEVRFDHAALVWRCNCGDKHRCCKHTRAVGEVLRLRRLAEQAARDEARTRENNFALSMGF